MTRRQAELGLTLRYYTSMTDATAKKQAELESDDEDDIALPANGSALFRDASSSPDLPPLKRSKVGNGISASTKSNEPDSLDDNSETEASETSTGIDSDTDKLVSERHSSTSSVRN